MKTFQIPKSKFKSGKRINLIIRQKLNLETRKKMREIPLKSSKSRINIHKKIPEPKSSYPPRYKFPNLCNNYRTVKLKKKKKKKFVQIESKNEKIREKRFSLY